MLVRFLATLLAVVLAAAAVAQEGPAATTFSARDVEARLERVLGRRPGHRSQVDLREQLERIDRATLSDGDWIDLHIALMALDRKLDPPPRYGLPKGVISPAALSEDLFDKRVSSPTGRGRHTWLLRRTHGFDLTTDDVLRIGERARGAAVADLEAFAAAHGDGRTWRELTAIERANCATTEEQLLDRCRRAAQAAHEAVVEAGLVTVPEAARHLQVERGPIGFPFAFACYQPAKLRSDGVYPGRYIVAPLPRLGELDTRDWFSDLDDHFMRIVSAHEGIPGHHLQFASAALVESPLRHRGYNSVYTEGWGFYSEGLLDRAGAVTAPLDRLALLRMRAWRAVRCFVDPALHIGRIAPSEARDLLIEESGMSRRAAEREVTKYMEWPTQPLGYWIGRREIESMRDAYLARHGAASLREFHDRLLGVGNIPLPLARAVLLKEREAYDTAHP